MRCFYIFLFVCLGTFQNLQAQTCNDPNAHNAGEAGPCETCFDLIQNGDEEGVDCGGSTPNCPDCPIAVKLNVAGNARIQGVLELVPPGTANLFLGKGAGFSNTLGNNNTFIGWESGYLNVEGQFNTFIGENTGRNNIGGNNTFVGSKAGRDNTTGNSNTFVGKSAGIVNVEGVNNTFIGRNAGFANIDGNFNTFVGRSSGLANDIGIANTFIGADAGQSNTSGVENTFLGQQAGLINVEGSNNTFLGEDAGRNNEASSNTFVGSKGGVSNTNGHSNTFLGRDAGFPNTTGSYNTFVGRNAGWNNTNGNNLVALGVGAQSSLTANGSIDNAFTIGNHSLITASHSGTLGNLTMQKLTGYVNFGTASDGRMKKQVREDVHGLDFILSLRPVSYQVDALKLDQFLRQGMEEDRTGKKEALSAEEKAKAQERRQTYESYLRAKSAIRYTGFIAQEVEKAMTESGFEFSGLVKPAHDQDHYSLRYAEFVVPLVKGMQEQQEVIKKQERENQEQQQQITQLLNEVTELRALVEQLLAGQNQTPDPGSETEPKPQTRLSQNFPNPFHEDTQIKYFLPAGTNGAQLDIYTVDGKLIESIPLSQTGEGQVTIKAGRLPAGTYLYSLIMGEEVLDTKRMVLTR